MAGKKSTGNLHRRPLRTVLRLVPPLLVVGVFVHVQFRSLSFFSTPTAVPCASERAAAVDDLVDRLRTSVTFLPLRDETTRRRAAGERFISSLLNDTSEPEGEARNLVLPSAASSGRVLCVLAPPRSGASYALAWLDALPRGAALRPGLTFVSEMSYDYRNLWHGLSALVPFASWHARGGCRAVPSRWALFHNAHAVRTGTSGWIASLAEAATGAAMDAETFPDAPARPACFERAVVFRRQMNGMSLARLLAAFDFMRCKARARCGVAVADDAPPSPSAASPEAEPEPPALRVTLLLRTGARAFKDEAAVARVFAAACARAGRCAFTAAHAGNLSFCDQVRLLSATDVLASPHGAQLSNMMFMDRGSSVMEFYPMGWRQRAGGGQFVYRWMADRAGMRHEGSWWDPHGEPCPGSPDILGCFKSRQIGHDEAYFTRWAAEVFAAAKARKAARAGGESPAPAGQPPAGCGCV